MKLKKLIHLKKKCNNIKMNLLSIVQEKIKIIKEKYIQKNVQMFYKFIIFIYLYFKVWIGQTFLNNVKHINKNEYDIKYFFNGSFYKIKVINQLRTKYVIDKILNEKEKDITNELLSFLGPKYDFHNISYQPSDFKYKKIKIYYTDMSHDEFEEKDVIILKS